MDQDIVLRIAPPSKFRAIDWKELWRFRDLFLVLAWRDIVVRYKQTALGVLWAIFQPLITMVIFTFIFNRIAHVQSGDGSPYQVFLYIGLVVWQYYSSALTRASESMIVNQSMVQKVYFPRMILPAAAAITGIVDLFFAGVILVGMMLYYHCVPDWAGLALLPVLMLCMVLTSFGMGLFLSALNVKYRDVRYALPFIIQTLMYLTPVIYPAQILDGHPLARNLMLWLNPISGVISNARAVLLGRQHVDWTVVGISLLMSSVFCGLGLLYFRSTERYFADIV